MSFWQSTKALIRPYLPPAVRRVRHARWERRLMEALPTATLDVGRLADRAAAASVQLALSCERFASEWAELESRFADLGVGTGPGGVNPGDRRAIYSLVRVCRPTRILEVGTNVGASMAAISAALLANHRDDSSALGKLVTVDIDDVNDPKDGVWRRVGAAMSARDVAYALGAGEMVEFVARDSLEFLQERPGPFTLAFLDGSHAATTVYREVPLAVQALSSGGLVLLHDYFPDLRPLWSDQQVVPGPRLALMRLEAENPGIAVTPLGELLWPTKLGSRVTSLALLHRAA